MARRAPHLLLGILFSVGAAFALSACEPAPDCTHQWIGPVGGDFGTAANWDRGAVPGPAERACAPTGSSIVVSDARSVNRVTLPGGTLHVTDGATLTLTGPRSTAGTLTIEGTRRGAGDLLVEGVKASGSATFAGLGSTTATKTSLISGTPRLLDAHVLTLGLTGVNHATITACDDVTLLFNSAVTATASSVSTAACARVGGAQIGTDGSWTLAGDLTSDLPVRVSGGGLVLVGRLSAPSLRQVQGAGPGVTRTLIQATGVGTFDTFHLDGGSLQGTGTLNADLDGAGTVAPGTTYGPVTAEAGTLKVNGDYLPAPGAQVEVEIDNFATDVLQVSGTMSMANAGLTIRIGPNRQPAPNATFQPIVVGTRVGAFGTFVTPGPAPWPPTYLPTGVQVTTPKLIPAVTWPAPGAILAGTPLSLVELNAAASVRGSFVYTPALGTVLTEGADQMLSVTFHPVDATYYADVTTTVSINVTATAPTVTWANPAAIVKWTPLGPTQLNATASVPGSFFYSPSPGSIVDVGSARPLSVLFVPTNRSAFPTVRRTVSIDVTAPPTANSFRPQEQTPVTAGAHAERDIDGDGRTDVVVVDTANDMVSVLRRTSATAFASPVSYPVGDGPVSVAIGDLNGDRRPDLVVLNNAASTLSVLLNTGFGAFAPKVDTAVGATGLRDVVLGELNGDGRLDALVNNGSSTVLLGLGTGSFRMGPTHFFLGYHPTLGDLNGDGLDDMAVVTDNFFPTVYVVPNIGAGRFGPHAVVSSADFPDSLAIGDVTGDGHADLVVAGRSRRVSVHAGNGSGSVAAKVEYTSDSTGRSVSLGDLNGDGRVDIAVGDGATDPTLNGGQPAMHVLESNGTGGFTLSEPYAYGTTGSAAFGASIGDVDGDHRPDLIGVAGGSPTGSVAVLRGGAAPVITWPTPHYIMAGTPLSATQLNASVPVPGTITYNPPLGTVLPQGAGQALRATWTPTDTVNYWPVTKTITIDVRGLGEVGPPASFASGTTTRSVNTVDVNHDGRLDLVWVHSAPAVVTVRLGTGAGAFGPAAGYPLLPGPQSLAIADLNGDTHLDAVVAYGNNVVSVLLGTGAGAFGPKVDITTTNGAREIAIGDINGDTKRDLVVANGPSNVITVLYGDGAGAFPTQQTFAAGGTPWTIAVADLNGDGKADVVTGNLAGTMSRLLGTATGMTRLPDQTFTHGGPPELADVNADGKPDLFWRAATDGAHLALGDGAGGFDVAHAWTFLNSTGSLTESAVADMNADGKVDIVMTDEGSGKVSVSFGKGDGTFLNVVAYAAGTGPSSVAIGDVNGDGRVDVAVGSETGGTVSILTAY